MFTDGWGEIHPELATDIARKSYGVIKCSAFQIRLGGFKGVLLSSTTLTDNYKVKVRKSMEKFKLSPNDETVDLEVIRMATYSIGYLNKQIIQILWSNGVDAEIFLKMQKEYIKSIFSYFNYSFTAQSKKIFDELLWSVNFISKSMQRALSLGNGN